MAIAGKMQMALWPYQTEYFDGNEKYLELKNIMMKLQASNTYGLHFYVTDVDTRRKNNPNDTTKVMLIEVPDNVNFWFQLTQLPKMLIPEFWKLTTDELENERMKLISNDDCVITNLQTLASDSHIRGSIYVRECYDSIASGSYEYRINATSKTTTEVVWKSDKLNHIDELHKQLDGVKRLVTSMGGTPNKDIYWGLWK